MTDLMDYMKYKFDDQLVLVVEDNMISFKLIEAMLSRVNLSILHARDGKTAIDLCKKHPEINVVLMDIQLPVVDGLEATRIIRTSRADLPVIATTANAFREDEEACFSAGCNAYITKPIDFIQLFEILESCFKK